MKLFSRETYMNWLMEPESVKGRFGQWWMRIRHRLDRPIHAWNKWLCSRFEHKWEYVMGASYSMSGGAPEPTQDYECKRCGEYHSQEVRCVFS